jgi:carbon monoxide dehydrogenase subunit G
MSTLRETLRLRAPAAAVWDAVRDVGEVHRRLVPGFVTEARMEGGARVLTFVNGTTAREEIVSVDDTARRLAYAIPKGRFVHYQGTVEVEEDGAGSRLVWTVDLLPDEYADGIRAMMRQGAEVMRATLDSASS